MNIDFSDTDILFIYGHFRKEAQKLEKIKSMPDCPVSKVSLTQDIKLFNDIADKLRDACPGLSKMDNFMI